MLQKVPTIYLVPVVCIFQYSFSYNIAQTRGEEDQSNHCIENIDFISAARTSTL